ncbi:MAG: hypothetical protein LBS60_09070 [Deltaproteobacteria bacterium]|jgi:hypothetical protein|nr:hypothetical protein [Deltaproteobacteria bacterium]
MIQVVVKDAGQFMPLTFAQDLREYFEPIAMDMDWERCDAIRERLFTNNPTPDTWKAFAEAVDAMIYDGYKLRYEEGVGVFFDDADEQDWGDAEKWRDAYKWAYNDPWANSRTPEEYEDE